MILGLGSTFMDIFIFRSQKLFFQVDQRFIKEGLEEDISDFADKIRKIIQKKQEEFKKETLTVKKKILRKEISKNWKDL